MNRYCLVNVLKKETMEEYKDCHKNAEKDLLNVFKSCGVENLCVFIYENLAIVYVECEDISSYMHDFYNTEEGIEWGKKMTPFLLDSQCIDSSGAVLDEIECLEKVFDLTGQLKNS
jgi:L-rhamnose mutarotase